MNLRLYQSSGLAGVAAAYDAGHRSVVFVLPTGGGKTVCFAHEAANEDGPTLIVCHRRRLIQQASAKLVAAGVEHGLIAPWAAPASSRRVQVGSVQTIAKRELSRFSRIIFDEGHHAVAGQWRGLFEEQAQARFLLVTATPKRLDGRALGDVATALVVGPSTKELVTDGYLTPTLVYPPKDGPNLIHVRAAGQDTALVENARSLTGSAAEHYEQICPYQPFIGFQATVQAAERAAAVFRAEGWRVIALHEGTPPDVQDQAFHDLASGDLHGIMSCQIIEEGVDIPAVTCVIDEAPTASLTRFLQRVGRAGRPVYGDGYDQESRAGRLGAIAAGGKPHAYYLDLAGNTFRHGMPDADRSWSLDGRRGNGRTAAAVTQCPSCYALHEPAPHCPACGHDYETARAAAERREIERRAGELALMTEDDRRLLHLRTASLSELLPPGSGRARIQEVADARGYLDQWVNIQVGFRTRRPNVSESTGAEFVA